MAELIAQGNNPQLRWQKRIPDDEPFVIGRASGEWSVPWDSHISRRHVAVQWHLDHLRVQKLPTAKNPIFYQGNSVESFELPVGQHFVIGATLFTLVEEPPVPEEPSIPMTEQTYSSAFLRDLQYRDSSRRVAVLGTLPDVIANASTDEQLFRQIVNVLLAGIPDASTVAIIEMEPHRDDLDLEVLTWNRRRAESKSFTPSRRLVKRVVESDESVLHVWDIEASQALGAFTMVEDTLWSFATPIRDVAPANHRWCIYVAGNPGMPVPGGEKTPDTETLQEDMKFTELASSTIANLIRLRRLERQQTSLRSFFSPIVMDAIAGADPEEVLSPRETEVAVLFCDLQGFSRASEKLSHDLMGLLDRVSQVLGLTTHDILEQGGVVGDFHGDATMGFWGWPIRPGDFVERACLAALSIHQSILRLRRQDSLADFRLGLGLATGTAVAGKIGTEDQAKVTVFGPVVNLAARLETMTRRIQTSILIDEETALHVRRQMDRNVARVRRIAPILPFGLQTALTVNELLPPVDGGSPITDAQLAGYEAALEVFVGRDWAAAARLLRPLRELDPVAGYLAAYIAAHGERVPDDWPGYIRLEGK